MQNDIRKIALQLVRDGVIKETATVSVAEARDRLSQTMANRYQWRIAPPDCTGNLTDDDARYAADCEACGVANPYDC